MSRLLDTYSLQPLQLAVLHARPTRAEKRKLKAHKKAVRECMEHREQANFHAPPAAQQCSAMSDSMWCNQLLSEPSLVSSASRKPPQGPPCPQADLGGTIAQADDEEYVHVARGSDDVDQEDIAVSSVQPQSRFSHTISFDDQWSIVEHEQLP